MTSGPTARLFVAVRPPPEVAQVVAALPRPPVPGLRWTTPDQWHVTLRFLGTVPLAEARTAFGRIDLSTPAVARLGPVVSRFGSSVLHAPVAGLDGLAAATAAATAALGEPPGARAFSGHLTLARARRCRGVDLRPLSGAPLEGRWAVTEVALVRSHLDRAGARYEVIAARPLPAAGGA